MKKLLYTTAIVIFFLLLQSCGKGFLEQADPQRLSESTSLKSESELQLYLNNLYGRYITGYLTGFADGGVPPFNMGGSPILTRDFFSDNAVKSGNASSILDNSYTPSAGAAGAGWTWGDLNAVNYFITHYQQALPTVNNDPARLDKYLGEALFFRALDYYRKVALFGDVPWINSSLNINSEELFKPRDSRVLVMDSVMKSVSEALVKLDDIANAPHGRINKDMAAFLKARIGLFEGSFRTYHTELGLQSSAKKFLDSCVSACEYIIGKNRYELYRGAVNAAAGTDSSYWKLFTFKRNPVADGNKEAILARTYDGTNSGHATQRYWDQNNTAGTRAHGGATRSLVEEYLCIDGKPIYLSGMAGNYISNPLFKGYDGMWSELENRDPRLTQTICYPGQYRTIFNRNTGVWGAAENGITYPRLTYNVTAGSTITGYSIIKHWMGDRVENEATQQGTQTAIEFRYGEVLLMLAEAKAILGTLTQNDLDRTVNALRIRAGFDFTRYPNSRLLLGQEPADPRLDAIYTEKLDYPVSPIIREIRRERRVELAIEGQRYEDLIRWKAGKLITVPVRGMKFTAQKQALYSGSNTAKPVIAIAETVGSTVFLDSEGFIIGYPRTPLAPNGVLPWDDKRYYWPLPLNELVLNKNLVQNPGWQTN